MDLGIKGKLALVTGSGRGMGRAIALHLAQEGAKVIVVARTKEQLETTRKGLAGSGHQMFCLDLMAGDGVARLIKESGQPDIVVHNVGGSLGVTDPLASSEDWKKVWQFNVGVAHELNRAFIPGMVKKKWGRIVHVSTLSTRTHNGNAAYVSAKCALDAYVTTVGRAFAKDNVILSAVAPGAMHVEGRHFAKLQKENPAALEAYFKEHLPAWRLGQSEDIGPAVAFLCSDMASFMTGSIVRVDGGGC